MDGRECTYRYSWRVVPLLSAVADSDCFLAGIGDMASDICSIGGKRCG